ncbi:MAG: hypothetical protein WCB01_13260 [Candidatus Cybelea sp.]
MRWVVAATFCTASVFVAAPADAKKTHPGPCRQGQVVSIVNRPGTGPYPATSGSPCTVAEKHVVIEFGYRNEIDAGKSTSILSSYPMATIRYGLDKHDEVVIVPPTTAIRAGLPSDQFTPAIGSLDGGLGFKRAIHSHYWYQDAIEVFVTIPTGSRVYTLGTPSYTFTYVGAFSPPGKLGIITSFSLVNAPGQPENGAPVRRFASYAPAITLSYELDASTSLLVNDNVATPIDPTGGTSNVLLVGCSARCRPDLSSTSSRSSTSRPSRVTTNAPSALAAPSPSNPL